MAVYYGVQDLFTAILRASKVTTGIAGQDFDWTTQPYYKEATEGQVDAPLVFCVYDVVPADLELTFENPYVEYFEITVKVVAPAELIMKVCSPYINVGNSIFAYLDGLVPNAFNSDYFNVIHFVRITPVNYDLEEDRDPNTTRVWRGEATYRIALSANFPSSKAGSSNV